MFIDYYRLLEIENSFTDKELKAPYKRQAIKWHPDKNPGLNTTVRMQQINEAFLILNDYESREKYRDEYYKYQKFYEQLKKQKETQTIASIVFLDSGYEIQDETLKKWIFNAQRQAINLAKQSLKDIIGMSTAGRKAILIEAVKGTIGFIILVAIFSLIVKSCQ